MAADQKVELSIQSLIERLNLRFANLGAAAGIPVPGLAAYVSDGATGLDKEAIISQVEGYAVGVAYPIGTGIVNPATGLFYRLTGAFTGTGLSVTVPTGTTTATDNGGTWTYVAAGTTAPFAIIKMAPQAPAASGAVDALGLVQRVYTPHVIKLLIDAGITDKWSRAAILTIEGEIFRLGVRVELYAIDTQSKGTKYLQDADIADANFLVAFESLDWPGVSSV